MSLSGINTSGLLRNRLHILSGNPMDPHGFTWDYNRMPTTDAGRGMAVDTGAFWDGDNAPIKDRFDIPTISGQLSYQWTRSNIQRGLPLFQTGYGDNQDLELSGIDTVISGGWQPVIKNGNWFDLDHPVYLYSSGSVEFVISGTCLATLFPSQPEEFVPISVGTFHVDDWGRVRPFETYQQKLFFTSTDSDQETLTAIPGTDPPLYQQRYTSIRWQFVESGVDGLYEFMLDPFAPGVVRNKNITSGVTAKLRRVPWSQEYIQIPIVPVVALSGYPLFTIYEDTVNIVGGSGNVTLAGSGVSGILLTSGSYVRVSGNWDACSGVLPVVTTPSGTFPFYSGTLLVDDGDYRREVLGYSEISGTTFSGLTRDAGVPHRDGAQVRLVVDATFLNNAISGVSGAGRYLADYQVSGIPGTLDPITGLWHLSALSGIHRVLVDVEYERGILCCYEPSGVEHNLRPSGVNINPLLHGASHGLLWASMFPLRPSTIELSTSRGNNADGTVGPVFAGNDYLQIEARVLNQIGIPVPGQQVVLALENPSNIGKIDGLDPTDGSLVKVTDGTGVARFAYTPPDTIQGLGYFADTSDITNESGLALREDVLLEELWASGTGWKSLFYSIWSDDEYLTFTETSGAFHYEVEGRFELVTYISGADANGVATWTPVLPLQALDAGGAPVSASGSLVRQLVFPSGSIPSGADIGAYFVSAEKRVGIGAVVQGGNAASEVFQTIIGIPPFMTGEFLFGPVDDTDTSAFDSLAYMTINPFQQFDIDQSRTDPRTLGQIFRIQGTKSDEFMRNKFYIGVDFQALRGTTEGLQQIRSLYTFRNRFILEV